MVIRTIDLSDICRISSKIWKSFFILLETKFAEKYDQEFRTCYREGGGIDVELNEATYYNLFYLVLKHLKNMSITESAFIHYFFIRTSSHFR